MDWWIVACAVTIAGSAALLLSLGDPISDLVAAFIGSAVFLSIGLRTVAVANQVLTVWFGLIPKRFHVPEIETCRVAHHETFTRRRDKRLRAWCVTDGRCVELTMKNGRIHRIGAIRPRYICDLLALQGVARCEQPEP